MEYQRICSNKTITNIFEVTLSRLYCGVPSSAWPSPRWWGRCRRWRGWPPSQTGTPYPPTYRPHSQQRVIITWTALKNIMHHHSVSQYTVLHALYIQYVAERNSVTRLSTIFLENWTKHDWAKMVTQSFCFCEGIHEKCESALSLTMLRAWPLSRWLRRHDREPPKNQATVKKVPGCVY